MISGFLVTALRPGTSIRIASMAIRRRLSASTQGALTQVLARKREWNVIGFEAGNCF